MLDYLYGFTICNNFIYIYINFIGDHCRLVPKGIVCQEKGVRIALGGDNRGGRVGAPRATTRLHPSFCPAGGKCSQERNTRWRCCICAKLAAAQPLELFLDLV